MDEFKKDNNNEFYEEIIEENSNGCDNSEDYTWYDDEYKDAMSGTISDKNALSIYRPKVKKPKSSNNILVAVISSVITACICCSVFALAFWGMSSTQKKETKKAPAGSTLSVSESNGLLTTVANTEGAKVLSIPEIYNKVSPSVASILCTQGNGYNAKVSSGSGVILTKDGYIVTNNHVIEGASNITVKTIAGQSFDAKVVGTDSRSDIAVLKVSADKELPFAEIGDSTALKVGDLALAIGNPIQEELVSTLTVGYISAIDRTMVIDERQMTMLQTDAAINPGNSGGALINAYGHVIGITTAKSIGYDVEGLGFAIPVNEAVPVIESIIKNGYVTGRPLIGIMGVDITEDIAKANDIPVGIYVNSVISGGAADLGGVKKGDVIIKCDGQEVSSIDEINAIRDTHAVGDKLEIVVSRNGSEVTCTIQLQEEKPSTETEASRGNGNTQYPPSDFFSFFDW